MRGDWFQMMRRGLLLGAAAFLTLVTIAHPTSHSETTALARISSNWPRWPVLHLLLLSGVAAFDFGLLLSAQTLQSPWRRVVCSGAFLNVTLYSAFVGADGLATAVLAQAAAGLPSSEYRALDAAVYQLFSAPLLRLIGIVGAAGWLLAGLGLAADSLSRGVAVFLPALLLLPAAASLEVSHAPPYGPLGFGVILLVLAWLELAGTRRRGAAVAASGAGVTGHDLEPEQGEPPLPARSRQAADVNSR